MYNENIMNLFANPKNVGIIQGASGVGQFVDEKTDDIFKLYIKVENETIVEASFKAYTGVFGTAVMSVLTELLKNKKISDASNIEEKELISQIGEIEKIDEYIVADAIDSLKLAISDYEKKLEKEQEKSGKTK